MVAAANASVHCAMSERTAVKKRKQNCTARLTITEPYQRPELRHAGPTSVNRKAELDRPSRVACSELLGVWVFTTSLNDTNPFTALISVERVKLI
jgi:hypothetical protein